MKKFLAKLVVFVILFALVVLPFNMLVDPYNIFHAANIKDNGVEPNKNYIKTKYVLDHKEQFDSYLFGSSRAGFYDVSILPDGNWYNLSYSEGLPKEQYETLKTLISHGEIPKQVYLSIDNISFLVDPLYHEGQLYRQAYPYDGTLKEKMDFYASYLDTITTLESLPYMREHESNDQALRARMYETGCEDLTLPTQFDESDNGPYWTNYYEPRIDEAIQDIVEFCDLCKQYDIKLSVFTNPIYITTYEKSVEKGYLDFLEKLSYVTPFYNFSGYNRITMDNSYYYETSHFNKAAGDIVLDMVSKGGNDDIYEIYGHGFGVYVDDEMRDDFLLIIRHEAYTSGILEYHPEGEE